jgi:hypothetical protein
MSVFVRLSSKLSVEPPRPCAWCRNTHDSTLPMNVQATSVRLLLNLVEVIHSRRSDPDRPLEPSRILAYRILDTLVDKLEALKASIPHLKALGTFGRL